MQRQLRDAIKSRYGVSNRTSSQVIKALAEIEGHRQGGKAGLPGRPGTQAAEPVPSIESIIGGVSGSRYSAQGGGLLGLIISIISRLFSPRGGAGLQGNQDVTTILSDLLSGASHPNQAPDLSSILSGLLGGGAATAGSGSQTPDIEDLVMSLLSKRSSRGGRTSQKSK